MRRRRLGPAARARDEAPPPCPPQGARYVRAGAGGLAGDVQRPRAVAPRRGAGEKGVCSSHFVSDNNHFTKTGSGQTQGDAFNRGVLCRCGSSTTRSSMLRSLQRRLMSGVHTSWRRMCGITRSWTSTRCAKKGLFCAICNAKIDAFTKTGSGQAQGKLKPRERFSRRRWPWRLSQTRSAPTQKFRVTRSSR